MEGLKGDLYKIAADNLQLNLAEGGFQATGAKVLEEAKLKPVYALEQSDEAAFTEAREKLNTEAGIIIANHPGYYDTFTILNALKRKDLKIVINESNYNFFAPIVGEELLIKATDDPTEALSFIRTIKEHIESGGIVLLYPTGGTDRIGKKNPRFKFKDGISVILRKCLAPTSMVYTFYIEPEDLRPVADEKISRTAGVVSAIAGHPALNINNLKDKAEVHVKERYSTAKEWQDLISEADKEEKSEILTEHFKEIFG
jgi:hypothetical protein